ncbi:helix-turn-helix transcriptional regulator [Haloferax denitrificans]|uniref:helix-turn-helix transcriptional regulator n=1 Tax=Haloferax denitrificans TaxID=35745 RepID=UPI003C6FF244
MSKKADIEPSFSETELEVIRYLIEHPEMSHKEIAKERGVARGTVNNAVARIRDKTRVAFATLLESPHTAEVAKEIEEDDLDELVSRLNQTQGGD